MNNLTKLDYKKILQYYNIPIPSSGKQLKKEAENILVNKLCRCIKKVDRVNESRSIQICKKSVINNKGFSVRKFTCKKRPSILLSKKKSKRRKA